MKTELVTDLVAKNNLGIPVTTSLKLAELFDRRPDSINRTINGIIKDMDHENLKIHNFVELAEKTPSGQKRKFYVFGEELALIIIGRLTGKNALVAQFKLAKEFISMRDHIKSMSQADEKMLKLTRINPQCLKAITGTRNNNEVGKSYEALESAGIMESVIEWKSFKRWRFTADGLNYCNGYHQGIPRFKDDSHNKIMLMIEQVKTDNPQLSIF